MPAVLGVTVAGFGVWPAVGLLIVMEAGAPIPIPDDLVMLAFGAQVAAGNLSWWVALVALEIVAVASTVLLFVAARGPGYAVLQRLGPRIGLTDARLDRARAAIEGHGRVALAVGRGTPGLRTVTGIAAGTSGLHARRALPPLILGATVFVQLHLLLGLAIALVVGAGVFWILRRGRRGGAFAWKENACPVCVGLAVVADRVGGDQHPIDPPSC